MDRLLSLSQAARLVGVPRRMLQHHIQEGDIEAFEGHIRMSELRKAFPEADSDRSGMVEKVNRIREAAAFKATGEFKPDMDHLSTELQRARVEIGRLEDIVAGYHALALETERRLRALQADCDKQQSAMLGTLVAWLMGQLKRQTR